jgi:hypothetical protein
VASQVAVKEYAATEMSIEVVITAAAAAAAAAAAHDVRRSAAS